jgi:hypothetical protein
MLCLREHLDGYPNKLLTAFRMPVVEARNQLAKEARELDPNSLDFDPHYALWVDDDCWFPSGHVSKAVEILEANPKVSVVAGLFCRREAFAGAVAVTFETYPGLPSYHRRYHAMRYKPGELTPLYQVGAHWFVCRRSLLSELDAEPFNRLRPCEIPNYGPTNDTWVPEDLSFFHRVNQRFGKGSIVTERSLIVGHVNVKTGLVYFPEVGPRIANGSAAPIYDHELAHTDKPPRGDVRKYFDDEDEGEEVWRVNVPTVEEPAEAA